MGNSWKDESKFEGKEIKVLIEAIVVNLMALQFLKIYHVQEKYTHFHKNDR